MLRRSETLFVHQVNADRRKRVVNTLYSSFDAVERLLLSSRIMASCLTLVGAVGMLYSDVNWGYRDGWSYAVWIGVLVWCGCGLASTMRSLGMLDYATVDCHAPMVPGRIVETDALDDIARFTCRLSGLCLTGIAIVASLGFWDHLGPKADALTSTVLVSGLLISALLLQISFKSFSGLYAPLIPHRGAPTILPVFALSTGAAAACCACVGLQFQPQSLVLLRCTNSLRCAAWAQWFLESVASHNVCALVRERAEKLTHGHPYGYRDDGTSLTGRDELDSSLVQVTPHVKINA